MPKKLMCLLSLGTVLSLTSGTRASLVGLWQLDEGAGNVAHDSSGNGNNGTFQGSPQWVPGKIGQCARV